MLFFVGISVLAFLISIAKDIISNLNLCVKLFSSISEGNLNTNVDEKLL